MNGKAVEEIITVLSNKLGQPTAQIMADLTGYYKWRICGALFIQAALLIVFMVVFSKFNNIYEKTDNRDTKGNYECAMFVVMLLILSIIILAGFSIHDLISFIGSPRGYVIRELMRHL